MNWYKVNFWKWITWIVENKDFDKPFSLRETTEESIQEYSDKTNSVLIWIDWTNFSSNVETFDASCFSSINNTFLLPWTDWVILHSLNSISTTQFENKSKIWIILGVADCSPIIWSTKDWDTMFNIHAWYKWVLWDWKEWNPWIIFNFIEEIERIWLSFNDLANIHLWPTAWSNFELPNEYYKKLIEYISKEYRWIIDFNEPRFFNKTHKLNKDKKRVWYLNLKEIIKTILIVHWIPEHKIEDFLIETTNPNNNWPSYRLYYKWIQEKNNRLSSTIFKNLKE